MKQDSITKRDMTHEVLAQLLAERTGQDLSPNRRWRVETALSALLRDSDAATIDELVATLTSPFGCPLSSRVADALLNNETYFFRDQQVFEVLAKSALPALIARRADKRRLSVWSVGCSTGQEPLSLSMLLAERAALLEGWQINIVATDVSYRAIDVATKGVYTPFEAQRGLGIDRMIRWFEEVPGGWKVSPQLLRPIRYQQHNALHAPPSGGPFDLVLCRNVLLYFDAPTRQKVFAQIAASVADDGMLLLGAGETPVGQTARFAPARELPGFYQLGLPAAAISAGRSSATATNS